MPLADVTVLLSLTVFMNRVSAVMPTTSDAIPLIGKESNNQTDKKSYLSFSHKKKANSATRFLANDKISFYIHIYYCILNPTSILRFLRSRLNATISTTSLKVVTRLKLCDLWQYFPFHEPLQEFLIIDNDKKPKMLYKIGVACNAVPRILFGFLKSNQG